MSDLTGAGLLGAGAGLASAATWALGSHLFGRVMQRRQGLSAAAANLFKNAFAALVFVALWGAAGWSGPSGDAIGWLLLSGLLGFAVGDGLYFAAFALCGVQLAALTGNLIPPLAALLGWWLEGLRPSPLAFGSMAVTLLGLALVAADPRSRTTARSVPQPRDRWLGLGLASLAALSQAFAIAFGSLGFGDVEPSLESLLPGTTWRLAGGVAGALAFGSIATVVGRGRGVRLGALAYPWRRAGIGAALVVPAFVAAVLSLPTHSFALGELAPGTSAVLFATTPLFTLPIGYALGARYGVRTVVGTLVAFTGVWGVVSAGV